MGNKRGIVFASFFAFDSGCFCEFRSANEITVSLFSGFHCIAERKDIPLQTDSDEILRLSHKVCRFLNSH